MSEQEQLEQAACAFVEAFVAAVQQMDVREAGPQDGARRSERRAGISRR